MPANIGPQMTSIRPGVLIPAGSHTPRPAPRAIRRENRHHGRVTEVRIDDLPAARPDVAGAVTFLFTDVEGSTRLWEASPDTMRTALRRHDELLRTAITGAAARSSRRPATG